MEKGLKYWATIIFMENIISGIRSLKGKVLVLTHHNADIDAVSSAILLSLGLRQKGIDSDIGAAESVSKIAKKVSEGHKIIIDPDCSGYDKVIIVETSVPEQLAGVKNLRADMIIDHHPPGKLTKGAITWIDEGERSAAQMIYQLLNGMGCAIDRDMAMLAACGIVADTSHLRHARKKEFGILLEIFEKGVEYQDVLEKIETLPDVSERMACLKAASRMKVEKVGPLIVAYSTVNSHEAASCRAFLRAGADISVVATERKGEVRISSRGRREVTKYGIDLSEIFKEVGRIIGGSGGGHDLAGSANGKKTGETGKAISFVLESIGKKVKK